MSSSVEPRKRTPPADAVRQHNAQKCFSAPAFPPCAQHQEGRARSGSAGPEAPELLGQPKALLRSPLLHACASRPPREADPRPRDALPCRRQPAPHALRRPVAPGSQVPAPPAGHAVKPFGKTCGNRVVFLWRDVRRTAAGIPHIYRVHARGVTRVGRAMRRPERMAMRYCSQHQRVSTTLGGWNTYTTAHAHATRHSPGLVEGACDQGVIRAKADLQQHVPHRYAPLRSLGTGA